MTLSYRCINDEELAIDRNLVVLSKSPKWVWRYRRPVDKPSAGLLFYLLFTPSNAALALAQISHFCRRFHLEGKSICPADAKQHTYLMRL